MGGRIFIEADEPEFLGLPLDAKHLYLLHRDTNGAEYVIRSGSSQELFPFFTDMKVEANVPIARSADARDGETPADRSSTELIFPNLGTDAAWALMVKYARMISDAEYRYRLLDENSNAFVGAMIAAAGSDPRAMLPVGVSSSDAIGFSSYDDLMADIAPPPDGTVFGTEGIDVIAGIQVGEVIRTLGGDDVVRAGRGDDRIFGGAGADRLFGQAGSDRIFGEAGDDILYGAHPASLAQPARGDRIYGGAGNDRLVGSAGRDLLAGGPGADDLRAGDGNDVLRGSRGADRLDGGTGRNTFFGGADADTFVFTTASTNEIRDFEDGIDRLFISNPQVSGFDDLTISRTGAQGEHTRIAFGDTVIDLRDVDRGLIGVQDFSIAPALELA